MGALFDLLLVWVEFDLFSDAFHDIGLYYWCVYASLPPYQLANIQNTLRVS